MLEDTNSLDGAHILMETVWQQQEYATLIHVNYFFPKNSDLIDYYQYVYQQSGL